MSTVKTMLIAKRYVEGTAPKHIAAARLGPAADTCSVSAPTGQPSALPSYTALVRLNALKNKAAAGAVPQADYDELHRKAFAGEIDSEEVRRQVHKLSQGIRHKRSDPKGDPDQMQVDVVEQQVAVAAAGVRSIEAVVRGERADTRVLHTLRRRLREAGEWPRPAIPNHGVQNPAAQV
jgi:hypothetical protein